MLKGKEFGAAIDSAIKRKLESGAIEARADVARHFGIKPPSIVDWVKKGSISKDKLPELWRYFSDVAGPEHWGLTKQEWPSGIQQTSVESVHQDKPLGLIDIRNDMAERRIRPRKSQREKDIDEINSLLGKTSDTGVRSALLRIREFAAEFPLPNKQTA